MNSLRSFAGKDFFATIRIGVPAAMPMGAKLLAGSYLRSGYTAGAAPWVPMWPMISVYPSGFASAARVLPVVPPAPATFSTTICCPRVRDMFSPTMRATTSVGPPAANGTMRVIGRSGYAAFPSSGKARMTARTNRLGLIAPSFDGGCPSVFDEHLFPAAPDTGQHSDHQDHQPGEE